MAGINALQASAIFVFLADIASALFLNCNNSPTNKAKAECSGPIRGDTLMHKVNYASELNKNFARYGHDFHVDLSQCSIHPFKWDAALGGELIDGGSTTPFPDTGGFPNRSKHPHAVSFPIAWDLADVVIYLSGYIDGFANYKLCTLEVTGPAASVALLTCSCS